MKTMIALVAFTFTMGNAFAADQEKHPPAQQAQQEKMKSCNAEAGKKELKGDERKKFMSECLGSKPAPATQQDKMKVCNTEAGTTKALKGDERKQFMSECLKADKK